MQLKIKKEKLQQTTPKYIEICKLKWYNEVSPYTRIIRDHCNQIYDNKMDNLKEMDKLLENYNFPKLNQEEIENMNRPITTIEIETIIKNHPANKSPGIDGFTDVCYQ